MAVKKDKRGRKKLDVTKDINMNVRFTKDEAKQIKKYAKEVGFENRSQLVRNAVLNAIAK